MSNLTISEILFEKFCKDNSILYSRIEQKQHKTPDYNIYFGDHHIIAEIKQVDQNENDELMRKQGQEQGVALFWEESGRRVRIKIDSAKKQLKPSLVPTILVLYDNVPIGSIDADDIKTAMYGQETVRLSLLENPENISVEIENVGFGSKRKFTPSHNTTFSAIALLYKLSGSLRLSIFHNTYARNSIDPSWLRLDMVKHYTLGPQIKGLFQEWQEI